MASYLVVTWDGAGNLVSTLGIARRLVDEGHDVRLLGHESIDARCGSHGWRFVPLRQLAEFDNTAENDPGDEITRLSADLWCSPAVAEDVRAELEREPADVILADCMLLGALCAGEAAGLPTVALFHSPISLFRGGPLVELLAPALPIVHEMRRDLGLPAVGSIAELHDRTALCLVATPREFDVEVPLPDHVRFVGPILDGPPLSTRVDDVEVDDDGEPVVVVSFSTSFQGQHTTLQRVADALAGLPVRAVVTTGPSVDPADILKGENTQVVGFVPHERLFPAASVIVTHAGLGTVMAALASGTPMVCLPMGRDQFFNAAMVERLGAGVVLDAAAPASAIAAAVQEVLGGDGHRAAAEQFAKVISGCGGATEAVAALEQARGAAAAAGREVP
ncbi:MAG TPA: glycosyltransferase [Acidimicrobiales bacterium]|nr:glycosyltransferase [Acidimicrobiales bacterium]